MPSKDNKKEKEEPMFGKYTLRPKDEKTRKEYRNYLRKNSQDKAPTAIILSFVTSLILAFAAYSAYANDGVGEVDEDEEPLGMKILIFVLFAELCVGFTIFYCLSKKSLWLIDLTGPVLVFVMQATNTAALFVFFRNNPVYYRHLSNSGFQFYPLFIQFCESDYLMDVITRMIYVLISRFYILD